MARTKWKTWGSVCLAFTLSGCLSFNSPVSESSLSTTDSEGGSGGDGGGEVDLCAAYSGSGHKDLGSGTRASPHVICNALQLLGLMNTATATDWRRHYRLGRDIDLTGYDESSTPATQPIGNATTAFSGTFNGRGYQISNFTYDGTGENEVGLFGRTSEAEIRNLRILTSTVTGDYNVGIAVGHALNGTLVSNVHTSGSVIGTGVANGLGGIAGATGVGSAMLSGVSSSANIHNGNSGGYHGGIVGELVAGGVISNCFSTGTIRGYGNLGGIAGLSSGLVTNCYSSATVQGAPGADGMVGGLVGNMNLYSDSRLRRSFFVGVVDGEDTGGNTVGPVVGGVSNAGNQLSDVYHSTTIATCDDGGAACNATGTYVAAANDFFGSTHAVYTVSGGAWSFTGVWAANASGYPTLSVSAFSASSWGSCASHLSDTPFAGGFGTIEFPYLICTPTQFKVLANSGAGTTYQQGFAYRVMQNIDFNSEDLSTWAIGTGGTQRFSGLLDGAGYVLSNMNFGNAPGASSFIEEMSGGRLMRLGIQNTTINAAAGSSPLLIRLRNGTVSDAYTSGGNIAAPSGTGLVNVVDGAAFLTRSYSSATMNFGFSGAGLVAALNSDLLGVFYNGTMQVGGGGGGPAVRDAFGVASRYADAYFAQGACTANCNNTNGQSINLGTTPDYFQNPASAVFTTWDFAEIWQSNTGAHPTLRTGLIF